MTELREKLNNIVEEKNTKITPENLRQGVEAFGVQGTFTSDATATAEDILKDKTAYVDGEKVVGTLEQGGGNNVFVGLGGYLTDGLNGQTKLISSAFATSLSKIDGIKLKGNCKKTFMNLPNLEEVYIDVSQSTYLNDLFGGGGSPKIKKFKMTNSENVIYMYMLLYGCTALREVEVFNASSCTNMEYMFSGCPYLTDESLNNILAICTSATKSAIKTLAYIGLTSDQATKCQSLSNYQAFLDAGWTTGY